MVEFFNFVRLGFGSFTSRFFLWWVDLLFSLWSLLLSRIFPWWLLTAFWVLAGKTVGIWLLASWEHLFWSSSSELHFFPFQDQKVRVLIKFVNTNVKWGFCCCFLCLLGRWFSRGWALGDQTFKLIIVEFYWFLAAPYSPFVANIRLLSIFFRRSRKSLHTFLLRTLLEACCFIVYLHNATFKFINNTSQNLSGSVFLFNFVCWHKMWPTTFLIFWRKFYYVKLSSHRAFTKHKTISNGGEEFATDRWPKKDYKSPASMIQVTS